MPDILVPLAFDRASQAKVIILKFVQGLVDPIEDLSEAYIQIKKNSYWFAKSQLFACF